MLTEIIKVLIENCLDIIIAIISIVVSYYIIPALRDDLIPFLQEKRLLVVVKNLVKAAEKMAESGVIEKGDKKEKVIELLNSKGINISDEVDALIEACVKELDLISNTIIEELKDLEIN